MRFLLVLAVTLIAFSVSTFAQQTAIVGTVTDPSGAVVPNVNVTITNVDTGWSKSFPTNDAGQYVAPDLQIGHYNVKAQASGFKVAEQKGIVLNIGDRTRVDFQMQMGGAQETVTVEANTVAVQQDSGEQSQLLNPEEMSQMAINGRSIYQLAALTPGASSQITGTINTPVGGDASVEFNGMRQNHNIYLLDGGEDDDRGGAGGMSIAPSTDAIAEFRALTSNYSADYGLSSAGTMTMVLKSGTSTIHASAWEFDRNDAFDARNFFQPAAVEPQQQELRYNIWGFNVGGPVTLGHFYNPDRKKTFFFYNMEWRRYVLGGSTNQSVPDPATFGGNFSTVSTQLKVPNLGANEGYLSANCPGGALPAGLTPGGNFPGNIIPSCMLNANGSALLNAGIFPKPTTNIANGQGNFVGGANSNTSLKEEIVRIDHNFSSKFSVFGHFIAEQATQGFPISQWSGDNVPTVGDNFGNPSYSAVVHTTYTISPTLVNEVAFNYNGNRINIIPYATTGLASLGLPSGYTSARLFPSSPNVDNRIPNIDLSGGAGSNFEISSWPWINSANDYQIRDDISWTKGAHQFKIGGSWALYKKVQQLFGQTQGGFTFNSSDFTGNNVANMLLGLPSSYQQLAVADSGYWNNVSTALWIQDNWRVNRRLTLNLGLRWDGVPHTYEANNRMGNFYPQLYNPADAAVFDTNGNICSGAANAPVAGANPGCAGASPGLGTSPNAILQAAGTQLYLNGIGIEGKCYTSPTAFCVPKDLVNNHWAAFGPRVGFAYDLTGSGKTVVRGGFGIMYERIQGNDMYNAGPNIPFTEQVNLNGVEMTNPSISLSTGAQAPQPVSPASITGLDASNYALPVSYQYSVGVQHSLTAKTVFSVSYVGNQGRHQNYYSTNSNLIPESSIAGILTPVIVNHQPTPAYQTSGVEFPGFNTINQSTNEANTHYNALQTDITSQLSRDLFFRAMYTLSRAVDPTTAGSGGGDLGGISNPYAGWAYDNGLSGYNRTHVFLADFIYDIPLLRHSDNRFVKNVIAGWEVSGIITAESGLPYNINISGTQNGNFVGGNNRPNLVGAIDYQHTVLTTGTQQIQYFNPAAFADPAIGAYGTFVHNGLTGPGRDNWNLSLFKNFTLSESRGSRLELRVETYNTWNHTQFQNTDDTLGDGRFGQFTSAFDPRILQLGGKIYF